MDNEIYEPPKKKLKKNKKAKVNAVEEETFLIINYTDECNEESVNHIKKHKKHKKKKDLCSETSIDTHNTNECNEESVNHIKKHKKHKKDKDLPLDIRDSSPGKKKKKSDKSFLPDNNDFVYPQVEKYVVSTNFTSNDTFNQNNNKNAKVENNFNETQLPFYKNKTKLPNTKNYFERKMEEKKTYYPDITETVSLSSKGRHYTVSIAIPASILKETCLAHMLRTYVIGNLARAACIYSVDEIIVYNDQPLVNNENNYFIGMMKMILEYQECPQYLRKNFFPIHKYLSSSGVLNALNAPHHLLAYQWCEYREGIILDRVSGKCSYADIGLKSDILLDKKLEPGLRVTVKVPNEAKILNKMYGYVVSPDEPRIKRGMYWGYTVRVANCLSEVFKSDRFEKGYDLIIGTSDKGKDVDSISFQEFSHALILFGGVQGLEAAKEADKSLSKSDIWSLCHHYVNVCPNQSSRTIRTEEAVVITLATLCPKLRIKGCTKIK